MRFYCLYLILALLVQRDTESVHGLVLLDDQPPGKNNIHIKLEINRYGGSTPGNPTQASEEGEYWFHQLREGEYQITASAPGYRTVRSRIEVHRGGQVRGITRLNLEKMAELPVVSFDGQLISRNELAAPRAAKRHVEAARLAFEKGDLKGALEETEKALESYPDYAKAILLKGQILEKQGQTAEAARLFEQAIGLDPDLYPVYLELADYYREQERNAELRTLTSTWKAKQPAESSPYFYSAIALYDGGEYAPALKDALLAFGFPHAHLPHLRLLIANTYVKLDQPAEALSQLEMFVAEYPQDAQAPEAQATILYLRKLIQEGTATTGKER